MSNLIQRLKADLSLTEAYQAMREAVDVLEKINMLACYASEENTDARYTALLEIGKLARGEMEP